MPSAAMIPRIEVRPFRQPHSRLSIVAGRRLSPQLEIEKYMIFKSSCEGDFVLRPIWTPANMVCTPIWLPTNLNLVLFFQ